MTLVSYYISVFSKPSTTKTLKVWKKPMDIFYNSYRRIFYMDQKKKLRSNET